jgi:hypothetical protein
MRSHALRLARRLSNNIIEWNKISALIANRLIALDKCHGVTPIGIGECLRRVLGKCFALATGMDVEIACGVEQLCSGVSAGIEGAVHAVSHAYDANAPDGWG